MKTKSITTAETIGHAYGEFGIFAANTLVDQTLGTPEFEIAQAALAAVLACEKGANAKAQRLQENITAGLIEPGSGDMAPSLVASIVQNTTTAYLHLGLEAALDYIESHRGHYEQLGRLVLTALQQAKEATVNEAHIRLSEALKTEVCS